MGDVVRYVADNPGLIGQRTVEHLRICGVAMLVALLIAVPLAVWLGHIGRGSFLAINASSAGRAVPSLAIIALLLPWTGLNDRTTIVAMVVLAIPPIFTNGYTAVSGVDRDAVEAARGMGMTGGGVLRRVELPLALPLLISGIRTAAVQVVATATLGAYIAGGGLGRLIVDGFASGDTPQLVTGAVAVALLAVLVEVALAGLERLVTPAGLQLSARGRQRRRAPRAEVRTA